MKDYLRSVPPPKIYVKPDQKNSIKWRNSGYEVLKIFITVTPAIIVAIFTYKISQNAGLFDLKNERIALEKQTLELSKIILEFEINGFEEVRSKLLSETDSLRDAMEKVSKKADSINTRYRIIENKM